MSVLDGVLTGGGGGAAGGTGDVVGPAVSVDGQIAVFDGITGKLLSASAATLTAAGSLTIPSAETIEFSTDTGLARSAAGVVKVTDGSTGYGKLETLGLYIDGAASSANTSRLTAPALGALYFGGYNDSVRVRTGGGFSFGYAENVAAIESNGLALADNAIVGWTSGHAANEINPPTFDTSLARNAAGVVRVANGSTGIAKLLNAVLVEANTAGSGTPNAIAATESGTVFTNEGATAANYHTLPSAAAGYQFTFIVQDADGIRIVANTDDTIRVIDKVTAAAGYIESTTIGSVVTLISVNAVEWYVKSIHGVWTDGTFTFDDTALTTP